MQNGILFLGDSFTWGEGLELYCDTPKWVAERNKKNDWSEIRNKQDEDGTNFREQNRFPTLVANHFNKTALVDSNNGGSLARNIHIATEYLLDPNLYIDTIILQFSALSREPLHLDYWCECNFCHKTLYNPPYDSIPYIIQKIIRNEKLTQENKHILDYFEKLLEMPIDNANFLKAFNDKKKQWYFNKLERFYYKNIQYWQSNSKRNIYFIDSWEIESSHALYRQARTEHIGWYADNRIPLISEDGKTYWKWFEWENTFEFQRIDMEFDGCDNGHPTLLQHQYLAKSIINFLEEKNYE